MTFPKFARKYILKRLVFTGIDNKKYTFQLLLLLLLLPIFPENTPGYATFPQVAQRRTIVGR